MELALDFLEQAPTDDGLLRSFVAQDSEFRLRLVSPPERFSTTLSLLALWEAGQRIGDEERLLSLLRESFTGAGEVHFFSDPALLPADVDCTVLALVALHERGLSLPLDPQSVLDRVASNVGSDGVLRVYFTDDAQRGERVDAVVCINALSAFARFGREQELAASERYMRAYVASSAFHEGTRYYPSPDLVLYFLSRLMAFDGLRTRLLPLLQERLLERLEAPGSALDLGARVVAGSRAQVPAKWALARLSALQDREGAWPAAPCFRYGRTPRYFGSEALTTAVAIQALSLAAAEPAVIQAARLG